MTVASVCADSTLKSTFDRDGYVVVRGFFSPAEVESIREEIDRYIREVVPNLPPGDVMYEQKDQPSTLKQLPHIAENDVRFKEMLHSGKTASLAQKLLGQPVIGKELEWFNKVPVHSRETPPHQDGYYFMIEPQEALTMWIALDDVDETNGCLRYVAGSHKKGLRPHVRGEILGFSQGIPDYGAQDQRDEIAISAKAGDVLVHHSMTIHLAHSNSTATRNRRSLGMIYYSTRAKQDVERLQRYQKRLVEEWQDSKQI
jgi:phytanoyl-CoA hydroxylase